MIYHLVERSVWEAAVTAGEYPWSTRGVTVADEGYMHASFARQVAGTSRRFYGDVEDLLLLCIDETRLTSPLVVEQLPGASDEFPHIYGLLDIDAVVEARPYTVGTPVEG